MLGNAKSTAAMKPYQIALSPKFKEYYANKRRSTNLIEVESPVDNITATSGGSNTINKMNKQQTVVALK